MAALKSGKLAPNQNVECIHWLERHHGAKPCAGEGIKRLLDNRNYRNTRRRD